MASASGSALQGQLHLQLICRRKSDAGIDPRLPLRLLLADHDGRFAHNLHSAETFVCMPNADRLMFCVPCTQISDCQIVAGRCLQLACAMPVSVRDGALLGAGMTLVAASTFFYRRKQTLPFKVRSASNRLATAPVPQHGSTWRSNKVVLPEPAAQVAYFLSWPVLGSAVILAWQPSPGEMSHMVKDSGIANESQLHDVRSIMQQLHIPGVACRLHDVKQ